MDNIEEMLRALVGDEGEEQNRCDCNECREDDKEQSEGLLSGLDPEMLIKLMGLLETLNQPDDSERFLLALKPLLRTENRAKIDSALRLIKLFTVLPIIKEAGILDNLI